MADKYIGSVSGSKGVNGNILIKEMPEGMLALAKGATVKIGYSASFGQGFTVENWISSRKSAVMKIVGIDSKEAVQTLKEKGVFADESLINFAAEDSFSVGDIEGCKVIDIDSGEELGTIKEVMILPANDVWVVGNKSNDIFLPVIDEVIIEVNLEQRIIRVKMMDGLAEANSSASEEEDKDDDNE